MGDRRNIVLEYPEATVALYTHWRGTEAPADLKTALVRGRSRWNDWPYLARIIFCAMVEEEVTGDTGYGIEAVAKGSREYTEGSDRDLIVDLTTQRISQLGKVWSYEEYIALSEDQLQQL